MVPYLDLDLSIRSHFEAVHSVREMDQEHSEVRVVLVDTSPSLHLGGLEESGADQDSHKC